MQQVIEIIKTNSTKTYLDEDGDSLNVTLNEGASLMRIESLETLHNMQLPSELKELLLFSNGMNLFGVEILPIESMEFFPDEKKIAFHNWGNGDFDMINDAGEVFFSNHSIEALTLISPSLSNWISGVIKEIELKGTLLHPLDYNNRKGENGLYQMCAVNLK